jgi:hypothetical protein
MKKIFPIALYSLLLAGLFSVSCNKDDDPAPAPKTKTQLITQSTWKFSAATVGGIDVSSILQPCQKDNIITFASNGSGTLDEGPLKCNVADLQLNPFTWSFQSGETQLFISATLFAGGSTLFNLVTLSETQLIISQNITVSGSSQTAVITFVH